MKARLTLPSKKLQNTKMPEVLSLIAGAALGFVFAIMRLPIPAPPTLAGVLGIVGITAGYFIAGKVFG
jgi:XapX domain-containing protein